MHVCVDKNNTLYSNYFELTDSNFQNNRFKLLKGKHKPFMNTEYQLSFLIKSYYTISEVIFLIQ